MIDGGNGDFKALRTGNLAKRIERTDKRLLHLLLQSIILIELEICFGETAQTIRPAVSARAILLPRRDERKSPHAAFTIVERIG